MSKYKFIIILYVFLWATPGFTNEAFQVELIRQSVSGTERVLLHMNKKVSTMGLTSNMLNFGKNTKIGTFEKKDTKSYSSFKKLYKTLNINEKSDIRQKVSPHAIEIWVNGNQVQPMTAAYKKIQNFAGKFIGGKGWRPIDAKLVSFKKNGQMRIENYESRKKKSVDVFFSAKICEMKLSQYACKTKLGTVYAPRWARRLPGTID